MSDVPRSGSVPRQTHVQGPLARKQSEISNLPRSLKCAKDAEAKKARWEVEGSVGRPDLQASPRPVPSTAPKHVTRGPLLQRVDKNAARMAKKEYLAKQEQAKAPKDAEKVEKRRKKQEKNAISGAKRGTAPVGDEQTRPHGKRPKIVSFALRPAPSKSGGKKPKAEEADPRRSSK